MNDQIEMESCDKKFIEMKLEELDLAIFNVERKVEALTRVLNKKLNKRDDSNRKKEVRPVL